MGSADATTQLGTSTRPQPIYDPLGMAHTSKVPGLQRLAEISTSDIPSNGRKELFAILSGSNSNLARPMVGKKDQIIL